MTNYNTTLLQATGNNLDRPDEHTFLEVSGGGGNTGVPEVHLMLRSNDGEFAQGWFVLDQLEDAVRWAGEASE